MNCIVNFIFVLFAIWGKTVIHLPPAAHDNISGQEITQGFKLKL
jgi:hypothetical protein